MKSKQNLLKNNQQQEEEEDEDGEEVMTSLSSSSSNHTSSSSDLNKPTTPPTPTTPSPTTTTTTSNSIEIMERTLLLLNLNRTNSNTSCNSTDSDYNSSISNSTSSASCSPPSTTQKIRLAQRHRRRCQRQQNSPKIISGFHGKAKQLPPTIIDPINDEPSPLPPPPPFLINYGDDVGFILAENIAIIDDNVRHDENNNNNSSEYCYFGIADGVSANRLRGYDARLFPTALLSACVDFIRKGGDNDNDNDNDDFEINVKGNEENKRGYLVVEKNEVECKEDDEVDEEDVYENYEDDEDEKKGDDDEEEEEVPQDFIDSDLLLLEQDEDDKEEEDISSELANNQCKYLFNALVKAHSLVQERKVYGSSTVCLLSLKFEDEEEEEEEDDEEDIECISRIIRGGGKKCVLSTCNLGDSGYMLMRDKKVIYKSQSQSHRFNAPFQIGCTPPELLDHDLYRDR